MEKNDTNKDIISKHFFSKIFPKGYEITDDALIFIKDVLSQVTIENENGHREFREKIRISISYVK